MGDYEDGGNRVQWHGRTDQCFEVERFEIRENDHEDTSNPVECEVVAVVRDVDDGRESVSDPVDPDCEEDREEWGDEGGEKENDRKEEEEFQIDGSDRGENKERERSFRDERYDCEENGLEQYHEKEDCRESEEFSEDEVTTRGWLTEDQIDRFSFYLAEKKLASDEDHGNETEHFDHREPEIDHDFVGLPERERSEREWEHDENNPEKEDHVEDLVTREFAEGVESDVEHKEVASWKLKVARITIRLFHRKSFSYVAKWMKIFLGYFQ